MEISFSEKLTNDQKIEVMKIATSIVKSSATTIFDSSINFYKKMVEAIEEK